MISWNERAPQFCAGRRLDDGQITQGFRVDMEHDAVVAFGRSLKPGDEVVLEATGNMSAIVRVLTPFVKRVIIANPLHA